MPFVNAPQEVVECRVEGVLAFSQVFQKRWNNTWHFCRDAEEPLDPTDMPGLWIVAQQIAAQLLGFYIDNIAPLLCENWAVRNVRGRIIAPLEGPFAVVSDSTPGEVAGEMDEPDDAIVLAKRTFRPGRSAAGRIYLPGAPDGAQEGGIYNSTFTQNVADAFYSLVGSPLTYATETYRVGVWSPTVYEVTPTAAAAFSEIVYVEADQVVRRMTSRDTPDRLALSAGLD